MAWQNKDTMLLKQEFLEKYLSKTQTITSLCREFNISRPTAYKIIERFKEEGVSGLEEHSRRPQTSPQRLDEEKTELIMATRKKYPAWGGRKLRQYLINQGIENLPSESSFNRVLLRTGLIDAIETDKRTHWIRFERAVPNELWQIDFKGHFKLREEGRCHPLTVLDDHSRFSLGIKGCRAEDGKSVKSGLEEVFREFGLPEGMTMDNGSPWKGQQYRLSKITIWLMRLGIKVSHSAPYHPQTQGKLERFHRSLKEEVLNFQQFGNLKDAQERFDEWRNVYNNLRPHEGINMACPVSRYHKSTRIYPEKLPELIYHTDDKVLLVKQNGMVYLKGKHYWVGEYLAGEYVGAREVRNNIFNIYFSKSMIKTLDLTKYAKN